VTRVVFWVGVALAFGVWVFLAKGGTAAAEYYAAYLLEFSLSVDNILVFVIVFSELHIPADEQRRVLGWGIAGALVLGALMIAGGIALIQRFHWITYPFAALRVTTQASCGDRPVRSRATQSTGDTSFIKRGRWALAANH
jgi:tellurite resistance protein TerC